MDLSKKNKRLPENFKQKNDVFFGSDQNARPKPLEVRGRVKLSELANLRAHAARRRRFFFLAQNKGWGEAEEAKIKPKKGFLNFG